MPYLYWNESHCCIMELSMVALKPYLENNCCYFTLVYQNGNLYYYAIACGGVLVTFTEEILNGKLYFLCSQIQINNNTNNRGIFRILPNNLAGAFCENR